MNDLKPYSRRDFIKHSAKGIGVLSAVSLANLYSEPNACDSEALDIHIFSKHLQFLDYQQTGEIAAEMGFTGVDLTVRPGGHVLPERVKTDLPKAVDAITKAGSSCSMITTVIESADNPLDVEIIRTAADAGVYFYRTNWYRYSKDQPFEQDLKKYGKQIQALGKLNRKLGIVGCYQNHAGTKIGGSFWEIKRILERVDPAWFGVQYDIRHAVAEGGFSWPNGLKLLKPFIKVIVLKDFKWGKVNGKWQAINTPIGEGMVDFLTYFKLLKQYSLKPPVSLHLEYPLGGAEKGKYEIIVDKQVVFDAMKKDLDTVQQLWKKA